MLDNLKFPIYPNINDNPREPTALRAGNASDAIARFNQLLEALELPQPLVHLPFNGNVRNLKTGTKANIFTDPVYLDYADTEIGLSLEVEGNNFYYTILDDSSFQLTMGAEFTLSTWFEGGLDLWFNYSISSSTSSEYTNTYLNSNLRCTAQFENWRVKFYSSSYHEQSKYNGYSDSFSSYSSSSSSTIDAPKKGGLNHVAIARSYEGTIATTSYFFNGVKVHDWVNPNSVLVGRSELADRLNISLGRKNLSGAIAHTQLFDRPLTESEVKSLYQTPRLLPPLREVDFNWESGYTVYVLGNSEPRGSGTQADPFSRLEDAIAHLEQKKHTLTYIRCSDKKAVYDDSVDLSGLKAAEVLPYMGYNKNRIEITGWGGERFTWQSSDKPLFYGQGDPSLEIVVSNCNIAAIATPVLISGLTQGVKFTACRFSPLYNNTSLLLIENSAWVEFGSGNKFVNTAYEGESSSPGGVARGLDINHNNGEVRAKELDSLSFEGIEIPISLTSGSRMTIGESAAIFDDSPIIASVEGGSRLDLEDISLLTSDRLLNDGGTFAFNGQPLRPERLNLNFSSLSAGDRTIIPLTHDFMLIQTMVYDSSVELTLKKESLGEGGGEVTTIPSVFATSDVALTQASYDTSTSTPPNLVEPFSKLFLTSPSDINSPLSLEITYWALTSTHT